MVESNASRALPAHLIDGLNPEQIQVVEHHDGALIVPAVAGCGKTRVLVHRMAALVKRGVPSDRILAVTFSTKAAREMNDRLRKLGIKSARVGTFHSVCIQIVRAEDAEFEDWQIDERDQFRTVVKDALGFREMDWKGADITTVLQFIGRCKAAAALPYSDRAIEIAEKTHAARPSMQRNPQMLLQAYEIAERLRRDRMLMTFDDMLIEAWRMLREDDEVRRRWAQKWDYVLQDECQDENLVQREIAEMLARDHRNYMVVGDPAQSIYAFRGADPSGMLRFEKDWGAARISMARNYRSGRAIIAAANGVLDGMRPDSHLGVKLIAERAEEGKVLGMRYTNFDEEGEGVVQKILEHKAGGREWRDMAILYRTNAQSRGVEEALLSARVPYVVIGGTNFYDRKEVKDLLGYLRIAAGRGGWDDVRRCINTPFRYLGKVWLDRLQAYGHGTPDGIEWVEVVREFSQSDSSMQQRQRSSAFEWCGMVQSVAKRIELGREAQGDGTAGQSGSADSLAARPARLLETLVMDLKYTQWLTRDEGSESPENNRVANVRELIRAAERFPNVDELLDYIDQTLDAAAKAKDEGGNADRVTVTSLHRSKGLEWPVVFLIGCNEKILPHAYAEDLDEERRLFYVGVTRARDVLELSCVVYARAEQRNMALEPSCFFEEAGITVTDHDNCRDLARGDNAEVANG